jgi:hypothetical protein
MKRVAWVAGALVVLAMLASPATRAVRSLRMTRGGMSTFTSLVASANVQNLEAVRSLCSARCRETHAIERSSEGGVIGLPRNIHKNFQVWREGDEVWLCPTNRVGPVYRLVLEAGSWKFDGLVGRLDARGRVEVSVEAD